MGRVHTVALALSCLLLPGVVHAQEPTPQVAFGYSFQTLFDDGEGFNLPIGWFASFAHPLGGSRVSAVGEVAGNYDREYGETFWLYTYQGGIKVTGKGDAVKPYAQFLAGALTLGCCGDSATYFVIEPGAGVDVRLNGRAALRLGASFPTAFNEGEVGKSLRFQVGMVVPVGGR